ncbi:hypothetical protein POM88_017321 [Heracleum sosnowskyi]|uniref:NAC domain-containing protein n=1 Tax=Heracleum sosnowskyi TaxID=360622 RepID=A0AAD8IQK4_9APIA|nr:hypothetical protein POM88_017321 [Heracleum sosnowskyi]
MTGSARRQFPFPPGGYFTPTDYDLIESFLKPKVLGQDLIFDVVEEKQVYGPDCNPWKVFDVNHADSWFACPNKPTEKVTYVFTNLSLISGNDSGVRTGKKAGCGTWGGKTGKTQILDFDGKVIGETKYLVFEVNEMVSGAGESQFSYFNMHEYCLSGVYEALDPSRNLVLCKITYDSSKKASFVEKPSKKEQNSCKPLKKQPNRKKQQNSCKPLKKQPNSNKNLEGSSVEKRFEESSVDEIIEGSSVEGSSVEESSFVEGSVCNLDASVCDDDLVGGHDLYKFYSDLLSDDDDQGVTFSLDKYGFQEIMNSMQDALVQDNNITNLGKRKLEAENAFGNKKICLG